VPVVVQGLPDRGLTQPDRGLTQVERWADLVG
jgi:hypothetical protein